MCQILPNREDLCTKDKDDLLRIAKELCNESNTEESLKHIDKIIVAVCAKIKARIKHDIAIQTTHTMAVMIPLAYHQSKTLIEISAQEEQFLDMLKEQIVEFAF